MTSLLSKSKYVATLLIAILLVFNPARTFAATVTNFSDTLSDSRASTPSNHTVSWKVVDSTGIQDGDSFTITFASGFVDSAIIEDDVDIADDGTDISTAADCSGTEKMSVVNSSHVLTFTACAGKGLSVAAGSVMTVKIGTDANQNGTGTHQITNPAAGSYTITLLGTGYTDSGEIQVATLSGQTTSLSVSASLSVTVALVETAQPVNAATTNIATTPDTIPFGTMTVNADKIGAHDITVSTNAAGGYTTAIKWFGTGTNDGLTSGSNNCDGFTHGTASNASPQPWIAGTNPDGSVGNINTCWYGYTTDDATLGTGTANRFTATGGDKWAPFDTAPYEIAYDSGPVNAQTTRVGHKVEVNALQPTGSYSGITEYVTTAVF